MPFPIRVALCLALSIAITSQAASDDIDIILVGKIYTADPEQPDAQALAISGGHIAKVGGVEDISALAQPETEIIRIDNGIVVPGFIDAHLHIAGVGSALVNVDLMSVNSFEELIERVVTRAENTPAGSVVIGRGWHQSKWQQLPDGAIGGFPTHHLLSEAVPEHPVLLEHANGHTVLLNAQAMALSGIDQATPAPEGGVIVKDAEGRPTGILHETATGLARRLEAYGPERAKYLLDIAQDHLVSEGVTSAHDAGVRKVDLDAQVALAEAGDLKVRLYSMIDATDALAMNEWRKHGLLVASESQRLTVRSIKVVADGALGSRTAWLHEPYSDDPETSGVSTFPMEQLDALISDTRDGGWQINVHAIGDKANSEVLDVFGKYLSTGTDSRFRIEHAQHILAPELRRFANLNVIASMQPIHLSSDRPWAIDRLGSIRIEEGAYLWQSMLASGVVVASGTDAPVEPVSAIDNFYAAVTRKQLNGLPESGFEAAEKLTREQALQAMTAAGAFAAFEEEVKGTLAPGKYADLVVLSQDIMQVPESQIRETKVLKTMVGGRWVYEKEAPDSN